MSLCAEIVAFCDAVRVSFQPVSEKERRISASVIGAQAKKQSRSLSDEIGVSEKLR